MLHVLYDSSTTIVNTHIFFILSSALLSILLSFQIVAHSPPYSTYDEVNLLITEDMVRGGYMYDTLPKTPARRSHYFTFN